MGGLKPYAQYKGSGTPWLGAVPEHWRQRPGRACFRQKQVSSTALVESTVLSLSYGRIVVKPAEKLHGLVPKSFETYQIVEPGDIVVRPTDLQNDWNSLRFGLSAHRGIITSAYLCFVARDAMLPGFAHLLLHTYDLKKVFYGLGSGLRQNLDWSDFKYLPCVAPPLNEQRMIVRFLDHADRRIRRYIAAKRKLIALLNEQRQAVVQDILERGLDNGLRVSTGNRWFHAIPRGWELTTMRRVIRSAIDGPHHSPTYLDAGIPFLSGRNIKADRWALDDVKFISEADYREFSKRVKPEIGDVLYTKGGTTGVARVVDLEYPFQVWVHVAVLRVLSDRIRPAYLALVLNSPRCYEQSQLFTRGATNQDLGLGRMQDIMLPVPPDLCEQDRIVSSAADATAPLDVAVARAREEIRLLDEYRGRLVADVVTGKLDVRQAVTALTDNAEESDQVDEEDIEGDAAGATCGILAGPQIDDEGYP